MEKKVCVTGATGLVGSHLLIKLAEQNKNIIALYRSKKAIELVEELFNFYGKKELLKQVYWTKGDILDKEFLKETIKDIEEVYHTAALVSFEKKDAEQLIKVNVKGTENLLEAMLVNRVHKLFFISSVATIRNKNKKGLFSENGEIKGGRKWTVYVQSKFRAEQMVLAYASKGIDTVIINPGVILGAGNTHKSSTAIFKTVQEGLLFYTNGINGFVDVRDVVDALLLLKRQKAYGQPFICVAENVSFRTIFTLIANALQVRPPFIKANALMLALAWRVEFLRAKWKGESPKITKDNTQAAMDIMQYDNSLLRQQGFSFRSLQDACQTAANFIQKRK